MNSSEPIPNEAESPAPPADEASSAPPTATVANEAAPAAKELAPSETSPPERVEKVRKIYVRDLQEKERIETVFLVTKKTRNMSRTGKVFLSLVLSDKTGDVDARIFERAEEQEKKFAVNDFVLITGEVISFHGRPQVLVAELDRLEPDPIDASEFVAPASREEGARALSQIRDIIERLQDTNIRSLLVAFLDDPKLAEGLKNVPATKGIHHGSRGGLADHVLSMMKLALRMADHYPMADRDLLVAGAFLRDIGRTDELAFDRNAEFTDEGRLVGHSVLTAQKIHEKAAQISRFPPLLQHHLTHLVLAHEGQPEQSSRKAPMTLEALIVDQIDVLDSRMASWLEIMARDPNERWTEHSRLYDRQFWKGPSPTHRARSPVDGRPKRRDASERKKHKPTPTPQPPAPPVVFKPLSELTPPKPASEDPEKTPEH